MIRVAIHIEIAGRDWTRPSASADREFAAEVRRARRAERRRIPEGAKIALRGLAAVAILGAVGAYATRDAGDMRTASGAPLADAPIVEALDQCTSPDGEAFGARCAQDRDAPVKFSDRRSVASEPIVEQGDDGLWRIDGEVVMAHGTDDLPLGTGAPLAKSSTTDPAWRVVGNKGSMRLPPVGTPHRLPKPHPWGNITMHPWTGEH